MNEATLVWCHLGQIGKKSVARQGDQIGNFLPIGVLLEAYNDFLKG
jgi:hypothetical protein